MPHHIVIVEDSRLPRRDYNLTSLRRGIPFPYSERCRAAGNYAESAGRFNLLDINLPDENGLMLTRALREAQRWGLFWLPDAAIGLTVLLAGNGRRRLRHQTAGTARTGIRVKNLLWRIDLARQAQPHTRTTAIALPVIA